jgi:multisubunit Na+/H+ antiporter MnhC subunit
MGAHERRPVVSNTAPAVANTAVANTAVADQPAAEYARPHGQRWLSRDRLAWIGAYLAAAIVLFLCYLRVSGTQSVSSDGGSNALEAWDMLHGNLLLHGWTVTDVSFYTTELPEYMLLELIRGMNAGLVHTAAACTYAVLVLLAGLVAKGRATGREGVVRVLVGSGIMLAPQLGTPVFTLLGVSDHVGTGIPLLLIFGVLDRAPRRWYLPPVIAVMLTWALVADRLVIAAALVPLLLVCCLRVYRSVVLLNKPLGEQWLEVSLFGAGVVALGVSLLITRLLVRLGGYTVLGLALHVAKVSALPHTFRLTGQGVLGLYGADFFDMPFGPQMIIALVHLAGVILAGWAVCRALRRFFGCDDLLVQVLVTGIVVNLAVFAFSNLPFSLWDARNMSPVLAFGAVLAGRLLAGDLIRLRLLPALAVMLACYTAFLGFDVVQPQTAAHDQALADWLVAHNFKYGLSTYFESNITTLDSGGRVHLVGVSWGAGKSVPRIYQSDASWYDPTLHYANFIVNTGADKPKALIPPGDWLTAFGPPAKTYHYGPYTILVWNKNLLAGLGRPGVRGPGNVYPLK